MWLAVMSSKGDSESGEEVELILLFPQSKTKAAFWMEGMHSYVLSDWDLCLGILIPLIHGSAMPTSSLNSTT